MRVWFNRTYATTCHAIAQLRANPARRSVHVIASHTDPDSPVLAVADQAAAEPALTGSAYVEWALGFAARERVDVLVPRFGMADLADARAEFASLGTALTCPDGDTVRLFEDKSAGYRAARELGLAVPPHAVVTDSADLRAAFAEYAGLGGQVCMKPVTGVGGEGYRRLTDRAPVSEEFLGDVRSVVRVADVCRAWDEAGGAPTRMLVMPFLDGAEVSVDVLATPEGEVVTMVGRRHDGQRRRTIVDDRPAGEAARVLTGAHRIGYLSNTQVRYWRGPGDVVPRAYLLEVNTRAAGGLFQTALARVNLPWSAVQMALGEVPDAEIPVFGASYVQVAAALELLRYAR